MRLILLSIGLVSLFTQTPILRIEHPDNSGTDINLNENNGILFRPDAIDAVPICVERENEEPLIKCITLNELRNYIWNQ